MKPKNYLELQSSQQLGGLNLDKTNRMTAPFGLTLSAVQLQNLTARRFQALSQTGRVEFGEGILPQLIDAFCDSPYIFQENYESTLSELQDLFYYFKTEALEAFSDDELISVMKDSFNGKAAGSMEYLYGTVLEELCQAVRAGSLEDGGDNE